MGINSIALAAVATVLSINVDAATITFAPTGVIQNWHVPTTGVYRISATGAQGGSGDFGFDGGRGALIEGDFSLSAGTLLHIVVGEMGEGSMISGSGGGGGGGGGGSFIVDAFDNPLLIAGGGGGVRASVDRNGCDASITEYGISGSGSGSNSPCTVKTTGLGQGGVVSAATWGSGGAGFLSDGESDIGTGGSSWLNGLLGGVSTVCTSDDGGFGGGGSAAGCPGGGGGGGYSGGDGGRVAGGGGSYNSGINQLALAGVGLGDGVITISSISKVPVPAAIWLFGSGLLGLIGIARRKKF